MPPTLNTYHTYMHLPSDETKRTWQKIAHALMTVPARSRTSASPKSRGEEKR